MPNDKGNQANLKWFALVLFAIILAYGLGILTTKFQSNISGTDTVASGQALLDSVDTNYIKSVMGEINSEYLGTIPDSKNLTYGVLKGIVSSLNDKYTSFLDPTEAKSYFDTASNQFEGIGITLSKSGTLTAVETVLDKQPAQKAGLKSGDVIVSVNDKSINGMPPEEVAGLIRGKADTEVKLNIFRKSENKNLEFKIVRQRIDLDNSSWKMLDNGIALIKISRFTEDTVADFDKNWDKIVDEVAAQNPKGIILDLRNNPGGYVDAVKYVAEEFLKDNQTIFSEQTKQGRVLATVDNRKGKFEDLPMSVLVNQGSASASEIFAAAMQDNNRGKVVGMQTVGKGVEQRLVNLNDNALLILVFRRWLTPNGRNISATQPIAPDFVIDSGDTPEPDVQLNKALSVLTGK